MKAAVLESLGLDNLSVKDVAEPRPGPHDVLLRMRAASLNFRDLVVIEGGYASQQKRSDLILLSDGAGEVVAVGDAVRQFKTGDRVLGCFFQSWDDGPPTAERLRSGLGGLLDGVACEYRALPACGVMRLPDYLTWTEAASLPCAALTAWSAVVGETATKPRDVVVTQGTGGVSLFALQFAVACGARVIATSSSDAKLARLAELGANERINYRQVVEWGRDVVERTAGRGADLVVEVGGAQSLTQSLRAVRVGGAIALIGVLSGGRAELNLGPVVTRHVRMLGVTVGSRARLAEMIGAMNAKQIRPVVDRVFPLAEIREALLYLKAGKHFGKVCIEI
ncbi:MAG TPA: NAD(P)-dependent alcohol dehydrogenase [Casimicrobiaceae bacterium]|nr:NAD(P)-dependent alcohol dehydrogenase [Casimicrobiaceae bacterium]